MPSSAVAERRKAPPRRRTPPPPRRPWWGEGGSPNQLFPGVTIEIPCRWVELKGVRRAVVPVDGMPGETRVAWMRRDGSEVPAWWAEAGGRWESPESEFYFDMQAADDAVDFFPDLLKHHMGEFAGRPFHLLEYQKKLLTRPLFGWKRTADDLRQFRKLFGFIPKGGGKSPWAAGTGVYLVRCDGEMGAEVYAIACDRNQARTVHTNAKYMVEDSPHLKAGSEILKDSIYWEDTRSTYMVLSSDAASAHGKRPHGLIFDELHGFSGDRYRELFEALKKSLAKRRQPVLIMITHSGTDDESLCFEEYEYAKSLLSGTIKDDTHLPVIFEAAAKDDWTSPKVHARVNPGYGITVKTDAVEMECVEAQNEPRKRNDFLRYHLNRWVNQATAWIPVDWWDACDDPMPSDAELAKCPAAFGIDMAQKIDLASGVGVFRLPLLDREKPITAEVVAIDQFGQEQRRMVGMNYRVALVPMFWLPEDTLQERVKTDKVPYDIWADEGLLERVEGALITSSPLVQYIVGRDGRSGLLSRFPMLKQGEFGFDPAFASEVAVRLRDDYHLNVVEVPQNYTHLSEACQVFEALVKARRVVHGGNRLMRWCVENLAIKRDDAGRIKPVKPKRVKRIDGAVASIIGLSRLMLMPAARSKSGGVMFV